MTSPNDPNMTRRPMPPNDSRPIVPNDTRLHRTDNASYTGWILGGLAALALILGVFFMFGRDDGTRSTASNTNRPAATQPSTNPPSTTGQRSEPIQPANPAGNTPTAPGSTR